MQVDKQKYATKQYGLDATARNERIAPQTPGRLLLVIQNTGANPLLVRFMSDAREDGFDFEIAAGAMLQFDNPETCPEEAINLMSPLGTTAAVLEGVYYG